MEAIMPSRSTTTTTVAQHDIATAPTRQDCLPIKGSPISAVSIQFDKPWNSEPSQANALFNSISTASSSPAADSLTLARHDPLQSQEPLLQCSPSTSSVSQKLLRFALPAWLVAEPQGPPPTTTSASVTDCQTPQITREASTTVQLNSTRAPRATAQVPLVEALEESEHQGGRLFYSETAPYPAGIREDWTRTVQAKVSRKLNIINRENPWDANLLMVGASRYASYLKATVVIRCVSKDLSRKIRRKFQPRLRPALLDSSKYDLKIIIDEAFGEAAEFGNQSWMASGPTDDSRITGPRTSSVTISEFENSPRHPVMISSPASEVEITHHSLGSGKTNVHTQHQSSSDFDFELLSTSGSTPTKSLCGALVRSVANPRLEPPIVATVGGVIYVDGKLFGITSGHAFASTLFVPNAADSSDEGPASITSSDEMLSDGSSESSSEGSHTTRISPSSHSQQETSNSAKTARDLSRYSVLTRGPIVAGELAGDSFTHFDGEVRRPKRPGAISIKPDSCDWALLQFPDSFDVLPNNYKPHADVQEVIIEDFEREKDLESGEVFIVGGKGGMISGRLHDGLALISLRGHNYDVKRIHLSRELEHGNSGAWVVRGGNVCGMIIASGGFLLWAYMLPIEGVLGRIRVLLEAVEVRLPILSELESSKSKVMLLDTQNADTQPSAMATEAPLGMKRNVSEQSTERDLDMRLAAEVGKLHEDEKGKGPALSTRGNLPVDKLDNISLLEAFNAFRGWAQHVITVEEKMPVQEHPFRLALHHALAGVFLAGGQVKEAVSLLEQVVQVEEQLAEDHPDRLASLYTLAIAYRANGQVKEAVSLLKQVVQVEEQTLTEDHPDRLASQHELAGAYRENGQVTMTPSNKVDANECRKTTQADGKVIYHCFKPSCKKTTNRQSEMNKHELRHEKPYGCTFDSCDKLFASKNDFIRHEHSQHEQPECWRCEERLDGVYHCYKLFPHRDQYRNHLQNVHTVSEAGIKESLKKQRISKMHQTNYWCGFCRCILTMKLRGIPGDKERFDHIVNHFIKEGLRIDNWYPPEGHKTKGEIKSDKKQGKAKTGSGSNDGHEPPDEDADADREDEDDDDEMDEDSESTDRSPPWSEENSPHQITQQPLSPQLQYLQQMQLDQNLLPAPPPTSRKRKATSYAGSNDSVSAPSPSNQVTSDRLVRRKKRAEYVICCQCRDENSVMLPDIQLLTVHNRCVDCDHKFCKAECEYRYSGQGGPYAHKV